LRGSTDLNARLALAIAPALLCVLALAGATALRRRSSAIIVVSTLAAFSGYYLLFPAEQIAMLTRWLPAATIAWIPNTAVAVATISLARRIPSS
jgi:lipopolysaccharide export LptBFGC system permease protein LptF